MTAAELVREAIRSLAGVLPVLHGPASGAEVKAAADVISAAARDLARAATIVREATGAHSAPGTPGGPPRWPQQPAGDPLLALWRRVRGGGRNVSAPNAAPIRRERRRNGRP